MNTPVDSTYVNETIPQIQVNSEGDEVSYVLSSVPCTIDSWSATNNTSVAGFVQIHDAASLPSNGAVPLFVMPLPADGIVGGDYTIFCETGAVIAISTTRATLTISTNAALFLAMVSKTL